MNKLLVLLSFCFLFNLNFICNAQTTADYFSTEGLTFGAASFDDTWQVVLGGYSFLLRTDQGDTSDIIFIENIRYRPLSLKIIGDKVFQGAQLYYDFGAEIGDTIIDGYYSGAIVTNKYTEILLNGEERIALDLYLNKEIDGYFTEYNLTWIQGIGDITFGLFPMSEIGGHYVNNQFGCAKIYNETLLVKSENLCENFYCPLPFSDFESNQDNFEIMLTNNTLRAEEYLWDFGDSNISTEENPIHQYDVPGCYEVTLSSKSYCSAWQNSFNKSLNICQEGPWFAKEVPIANYAKRVKHFSKEKIFLWAKDSLIITTNQGDTWEIALLPFLNNSFDLSINNIHMFDDEKGFLLANLESPNTILNKIYLTSDGGSTWRESNFSGKHAYATIVLENGKAILDGDSDQMYITNDFGFNWDPITFPDNYYFNELYAKSDSLVLAQVNTLEGSTQKYWIATSFDFGTTWSFKALPDFIHQVSITSEDVWYGARLHFGEGLFKSSDQGETWTEILPNVIKQLNMINDTVGWCVVNPFERLYTTDGFQTYSGNKCAIATRWLSSNEVGSGASVDSKYLYYFDPDKAHTCLDVDSDGDGYFDNTDCNDSNAEVNPGALEIPYNGIDDDCDPLTLDDDLDQDGFVNANDCDDMNPAINPNAIEIPNNGIDENCDDLDYITKLNEQLNFQANIYPNPTKNLVKIEVLNFGHYRIKLRNSLGVPVMEQNFSKSLSADLSTFPTGIYFIEIKNLQNGAMTLKQLVRI